MTKRTEFTLKEPVVVNGEYIGNEGSGKVLVFSHGFGVLRDSRGMFIQMAKLLKEDYLVVMFDYSEIDPDGNTTTQSFSVQARMLKSVLKFTREKFGTEKINVIAHSQGCIITGLVGDSNLDTVILMAAPVSPVGDKIKAYFSQRPETKINEKGVSTIKRSDGSITCIPASYWKDANTTVPSNLFAKMAKKSKVIFIRAKQDQVVTGEDYEVIKNNPDIEFIELKGNHDFSGYLRKPLLRNIVEIFGVGS